MTASVPTARHLALVSVIALTACQGPAAQYALPPGPQVVEVEMDDYGFTYDPSIGPGRVLFRVRNTGAVRHSLTLLPLNEEIPPIDQQLRGSTRRAITPLAVIRSRQAGASTSFAADLAPGARYAFVCFLDDADGTPHWVRGMTSEFRTTGAR